MMTCAWMIEWAFIVGGKLPIGPETPLPIYIFPTCGISKVHRLFTQWCDTRGMRDEYYVGLDFFWKFSKAALKCACRVRRVLSKAAPSASAERTPLPSAIQKKNLACASSTRSVSVCSPSFSPSSRSCPVAIAHERCHCRGPPPPPLADASFRSRAAAPLVLRQDSPRYPRPRVRS